VNEKDFEKWIEKNPLLANCVYPVFLIAAAMFVMFSTTSIINYTVS